VRFLARATLAVLVLAVLAADASAAEEKAQEGPGLGDSTLERFKSFISSPPVVSNLVFQQKVPMGGGGRPLDGTFALSTSFDGGTSYNETGGAINVCNGPAEYTDCTSHTQSVNNWQNGTYNSYVNYTPLYGPMCLGTTSGATCN
jgi:hypothetical protein